MAIALSPSKTWDYVLNADRELSKDQQTIFKLRSLTTEEYITVFDSDGGAYKRALIVVIAGVRGWENFKDTDGKVVEPVLIDGYLSAASANAMSVAIVLELARAINLQNNITEDETKN